MALVYYMVNLIRKNKAIIFLLSLGLFVAYLNSISTVTHVYILQNITPHILLEDLLEPTEEVVEIQEEQKAPVQKVIDITLTRYYPSESDSCTSKMCIDQFEVNSKGWFTYKGKVVIAAATYLCLTVDHGGCAKITKAHPFPKDYIAYNFYDEIKFIVEGTEYIGVVLDSCGACMYKVDGENKPQRYDIFVSSWDSSLLTTGNIGKTSAQLVINKEEAK